jgi:type III pantothenate kinase
MILAFDLGNTNVTIGLCKGADVSEHFRIATDRAKTSDDYWVTLSALLPVSFEPEGIVLSSVVPDVEKQIQEVCVNRLGMEPHIIRPAEMDLLPLAIDEPREVGADRVVNCYAASRLYGRPAVVIDFGTATTFDILSENGAYAGGLILPGPRVAMEALVRHTALLPRIEFRRPDILIGRNTREAMTAGIYYGLIAQIEGIVERLRDEFSAAIQIITTGGLGKTIAQECPFVDHIEPLLTLKGLGLIFEDFFQESEI